MISHQLRSVAQAQAGSSENLIGLVLGVLALAVGLAALFVLCDVALPNIVARARHNAERMPFRSFAVGLINFTFFGLIAAAFLSGDQGAKLIGVVVGTILLSFVALGIAAVARLIGERLRPDDPSPVRQIVVGAAVLELAAFVPLVGWFMVPALAGLIGYGATIIALVRRPRTEGQEPRTGDLRT